MEAFVQCCSVKKCSQKFDKIHRKTPVPESLRPATLLKKRLWHRCFPVSFVKFLRLHRTPLVAASECKYLQLTNFCNCKIPNQQLRLCNTLSLQKRLNLMSLLFLFSSLFGKIQQLRGKVSKEEKSMYYKQKFQKKKKVCINHWNLMKRSSH